MIPATTGVTFDAETAVLGRAMINTKACEQVMGGRLRAEHFSRESHGWIFSSIKDIWAAGADSIDPIMVCDSLATKGQLEIAGGRAYIHSLVSSVPAGGMVEAHVGIILRDFERRELIRLLEAAQMMTFTSETERAREQLIAGLDEMSLSDSRSVELVMSSDEVYGKVMERVMGVENGEIDPAMFDRFRLSRWPTLDKFMGPLEPGSLTVVAARPSVGKTMFLHDALRLFCKHGLRCLFISREMIPERIVWRHMVFYGVDMQRLRRGKLEPRDWEKLEDYRILSKNWDVTYDSISTTVAQIRQKIRKIQPDVVFIDYLQRLTWPTGDEYTSITQLTNEIQDMTLDTGVVTILASQLRRPQQGKEHIMPSMSDTRGSGAVEERATNLLIIHRDWTSGDNKLMTDKGLVLIAKQADGAASHAVRMDFKSSMAIIESGMGEKDREEWKEKDEYKVDDDREEFWYKRD